MTMTNTAKAVIQHADDAVSYRINPFEEIRIKVSSDDTNDAYCVIEHRGQADAAPPLHLHREIDEIFEVLEGRVGFYLDGKRITAEPGTTVAIPRNMAHTWRNIGGTPSRMVVTFIPGGTDRFFEAVEGIVHEDARAALLAEKFDTVYLGPPLGPENWTGD
jgi:quercetin dioxygenase-like cupin family protein